MNKTEIQPNDVLLKKLQFASEPNTWIESDKLSQNFRFLYTSIISPCCDVSS